MIGTRAHGKTKVYRYYTCFNRSRYDTEKCDATRINADAVEPAVLEALGSFYRDHHSLIADAFTRAQAQHLASQDNQRDELGSVEADSPGPTMPSTATSAPSRTARWMRKTSPPDSPRSRPRPNNCAPAATNSPIRSPTPLSHRPEKRSPRSPTTPQRSSEQAATPNGRLSSKR